MSDVARPRRPASPRPGGPAPPRAVREPPLQRERPCVGWGAPPAPRPRPRRHPLTGAGAHRDARLQRERPWVGVAHVRRTTAAPRPRAPASHPLATPGRFSDARLQRERPCVGWGACPTLRGGDAPRPRPPAARPTPGGSRTAPTTGAALRGVAHVRVARPRRPTSPPPASHPLAARGRIGDARLQRERPWVGGRMSDVARPRRPTSPRPVGPPHPGRFANRPYNGSGLAWGGARRPAPRPRPRHRIRLALRGGASAMRSYNGSGLGWGGAHVRRCAGATPRVPTPRRPPPPGRFANRPYNGSGLAWVGASAMRGGIARRPCVGAHQRCAATAPGGLAWRPVPGAGGGRGRGGRRGEGRALGSPEGDAGVGRGGGVDVAAGVVEAELALLQGFELPLAEGGLLGGPSSSASSSASASGSGLRSWGLQPYTYLRMYSRVASSTALMYSPWGWRLYPMGSSSVSTLEFFVSTS